MTKKEIIIGLFSELNKHFDYAILHNVEDLFEDNKDIDLVINTDSTTLLLFLQEFCLSNQLLIVNYYKVSSDIYRFDLLFIAEKIFNIELDCACNSRGRDELSIKSNELLKNKKEYYIQDIVFFKISDEDEYEYYLKKKAYKHSVLNENINILDYLEYFQKLIPNSDEEKIKISYNIYREYYKSKTTIIKLYFLKIKRVLVKLFRMNSMGLSICFLGPDGSGKSTIINGLLDQKLPFRRHDYFHLKPMPQKDDVPHRLVSDPHKFKPYSFLKSYIKLLFFVYQYNLGWLKHIKLLKVKSSLVVFDRYFDDILVDHKRYRYGGSKTVAKFIRFFIPKPELYFILTADANIIYNRKEEVELRELERQIKAYRSLADNKRYININVNKEPKEIVLEITKIIMQHMNGRY